MKKKCLIIVLFISMYQLVHADSAPDSLLNYFDSKLENCISSDYDSVQLYLNDLGVTMRKTHSPKLEFLFNKYNALRYSYQYTSAHNSIDSVRKYYLNCIEIGNKNDLSISNVYYKMIYEHVVHCENDKVKKYLTQYRDYLLDKKPELLASKYSAINAIFYSYCLNQYDSAIHYYKKSVDFYKEKNEPRELAIVLENIGMAYLELNDAKMAKEYLNNALVIEKENGFKDGESFCKYQLARIIYRDEPQLAKTYLMESKTFFVEANQLIRAGECSHLLASLYQHQGNIKKAKESITESIQYLGPKNNSSLQLTVMQSYAEILFDNNEYNEAIEVAQQTLKMNQSFKILKKEIELHEILYKSLSKIGNKDKAFNILLRYNVLKDSLSSEEQSLKIKEIEEKYQSVKKEKALALANQQKKFFKKQRWLFAGGAALLGLFGLLYFRQRNKKKIKELQAEMAEVQLASLKSQMNPHFMFNSINSIKGLIINDAAEAAADQLTRFSKLMRSTLNYSSEKEIPLSDEIEFLTTYSELERFKGNIPVGLHFDIDKEIDAQKTSIIPFLIQPFLENSFKHAFHNMGDRAPEIRIEFEKNGGYLNVEIEDNGSGVKNENASLHESKGTMLVEKRLELQNKEKDNVSINFRGEAQGTLVSLKIKQ